MKWLSDLIANPFFLTGISSWFIAQVLKTIIHTFVSKKIEFRRLWGDGGMPSGHSATVSSIAIMSALIYGTGSFQFAISAILTIIVCHDAMGVRRETGNQAMVLNRLVKTFRNLTQEKIPEAELKEFVGHTPVQVLVGIIVGVTDAFVIYHISG